MDTINHEISEFFSTAADVKPSKDVNVEQSFKCRMCGKFWRDVPRSKDFLSHLVSSHFKHLWAKEVPAKADMFSCHMPECTYQVKVIL